MDRTRDFDPEFHEKFGLSMATARSNAGKSQEYVADVLGVAKKTVAKWEKGESCPSLTQAYNYFGCLGLNMMPYYLECLYPDVFHDMQVTKTDEEINRAIDKLGEVLPMGWKRALLFILLGNHGSSPYGILQLTVAHLHTPLKDRVLQANQTYLNFIIHEQMGDLVNEQYIMPDIQVLDNAIRLATKSVVEEKGAYICDQFTNLIREGLLDMMDEFSATDIDEKEIIKTQEEKIADQLLKEAKTVEKTNPKQAKRIRRQVSKVVG